MSRSRTIGLFLFIQSVVAAVALAGEPSMDMHHEQQAGTEMQREEQRSSAEGSGTSMLPGSSPMYAKQFQAAEWQMMLHGSAFMRYTDQDAGEAGERGNSKVDAPNWLMLSGSRESGGNSLTLRAMMSLDPVTEGRRGYPLLFQTGETAGGKRLIDRQHPHDLLGELAVSCAHSFNENNEALFYFGLPGEPALGPTVYLHRPSAVHNPDAPLGHHWQDSTHISYGVATIGYRYKWGRVESSFFNGKEPDEKRFDIDSPRFNSYSARLQLNPTANSAYQVSYGALKTPEALEPGIDVRRATASLIYNRPLGGEDNLAASLVWGLNKPEQHDVQRSFLVEADYSAGKHAVFSRLEVIRKSGTDLGVAGAEEEIFLIDALSAGAERTLYRGRDARLSLGLMGTVYRAERELRNVYGNWPFSIEVFLQLTPALMQMSEHGHAL